MNNDPKKWNLFKFIRGSVGKSDTDGADTQTASEQGRAYEYWHRIRDFEAQ